MPLVILASCWLLWSAPGDDGMVGRATRYEVRYSPVPTPTDTAMWLMVPSLPVPSEAGQLDSVRVAGLDYALPYRFVMRAVDDAGNWSHWSNVGVKSPGRAPEMIVIRPDK